MTWACLYSQELWDLCLYLYLDDWHSKFRLTIRNALLMHCSLKNGKIKCWPKSWICPLRIRCSNCLICFSWDFTLSSCQWMPCLCVWSRFVSFCKYFLYFIVGQTLDYEILRKANIDVIVKCQKVFLSFKLNICLLTLYINTLHANTFSS